MINTVFSFGEKLGDVFMGLLFVQYLTTVATSCIELCLMSKTMYDFTRILKFVVYMSTIVSQMAIFCFLSEAVTDEVGNQQSYIKYCSNIYLFSSQ